MDTVNNELSDWKQSLEINELACALAQAQGEMGNAKKSSDNPYFKSKYADLAEIVDVLKPVLSKYGISYIQLPGRVGSLTTQLMHKSGQWIRQTATVKLSKEDPQSAGSGITYLRRYALAGATGLAQEDDDGNAQIPGKKGGSNPYQVQRNLAAGLAADALVFKYDISKMDEDRQKEAQEYLEINGAVFDDENLVWETKGALKRLKEYQVK